MQIKTYFSKVVAIICAITVAASVINLPAAANTSDTTNGTYKVIGAKHIAGVGEDGIYTQTSGRTPKRLNNISNGVITSMDGVMFDGLFNFGTDGIFTIAQDSINGRFQLNPVTKPDGNYLRYQLVGATDALVDVPVSQLFGDVVGRDVRIKIGFTFADVNTTNNTADVTVHVQIGSTYEGTITANDHTLANTFVNSGGVVVNLNGALTVKEAPKEADYKKINVNYIAGVTDGVYTQTSGRTPKRLNNISDDTITTMDGVMFDGLFNFGTDGVFTIAQDSIAQRFQLNPVTKTDGNYLRYQLVGAANAARDIPVSQLGGDVVGRDVHIKIGFTFTDVNTTNNTADVTVHIKIGNLFEDFITANDHTLTNTFVNSGGVVVNLNGALSVKAVKADSDYKTIGIGYVAGVTDGVYTQTSGRTPKRLNNISGDTITTMDGVMFDGLFNFGTDGTFTIAQDSIAGRFQLQPVTKDNVKYLRYQLVGAANTVTDVPVSHLEGDVIGRDVRIKIGFTFTDVNTANNTADITVHMRIGDEYEDLIVANDHTLTNTFVNSGGVVVNLNGALTVKEALNGGQPAPGPEPEPEPEFKPDSEYKPIGISHVAGVTNGIFTQTSGRTPKRLNNISDDTITTMDGVMFDGLFNFGTDGIFTIAQDSINGRFQLNPVTKADGNYLRYQLAGVADTIRDIPVSQLGGDVVGRDVRIKIGFTFADVNTTNNTADVTVHMQIGSTYEETITANDHTLTNTFVNSGGVVVNLNGALTVKEAPKEADYKKINVNYIAGVTDGVYIQTSGRTPRRLNNISDDKITTMDGVMFDGLFNFGTDGVFTIAQDSIVGRFQLNPVTKADGNYLRYQFVGVADAARDIPVSQLDGDVVGRDVRIKIGFTFSDVNTTNNTADITVYIKIGDDYEDLIVVNDHTLTNTFVNSGGVVVNLNGALTVKEALDEGQPAPEPKPEPEYKPDSAYTLVAVQDFTGDDEHSVTGTEGGMRPSTVQTTGTLDGLLIDGIYNFVGTPVLNMGGRQVGLQFQIVENAGVKYLCYQLVGTGIRKDVSAEMAGCEIYGADVRIKAGFTFSNVNAETGAADVEIQISIGDTYKDIYTAKGYANAVGKLARILFVDARTANSTLVMKAIEKPAKELPPVPQDSEYKQINFADFGITQENVITDKEIGFRAGAGNFNGYMIDGVYNFSGTSTVNLGGKNKGLQINLVEKSGKKFLRYQLIGSGMATDVSAKKAGGAIEGTDLPIKVGFTFANVNEAAGTADVTVQIRIGENYKDVFVVKGYKIAQLERILFIDARGKGNQVILRKPYMEPFDFREFGFTENYEVELRLKKK